MSSFEVNTKLEAYKLIHDPTKLLSLLYSKYGDIEEDYNLLFIEQLIYNKSSHFNNLYKENILMNNNFEFLRRAYDILESDERIPKLGDYYKNYYAYYCKPFFIDVYFSNLLRSYFNNKAEIFYKNNYSCSKTDKNEINDKKSNSNTIMTSIDNDTQNKTIFNKKNRYIIDNNTESYKYSNSFSTDNFIKTDNELISKRSENDSFQKFLKNFIDEYNMNNYKLNNKKIENIKNNKINKNKNPDLTNFLNKNKNNNKEFIIKNKNNKKNSNLIKKDDSYSNIITDIKKNFYNISKKNKNNEKPVKITRNMSNLENYKMSTINITLNKKNNDKNIINKNNNLNKSETKYLNESNTKNSNKNYNDKNFFKLNNKFKENKNNQINIAHIESRNRQKIKENDLLNNKNFISIKNNKNNNNFNFMKLFKVNKNNIYNNIKINNIEIKKNIKNNINNKNIDINIDSKKLNNIIKSPKRNESNKKINIISKLNSLNYKNCFHTNFKLNNNNNNHKFKKYIDSLSPKSNALARNKILFKKNSKTTDKLVLLDSIILENNFLNSSSIRKEKNIIYKSNSNYSKRHNKNINFINNMKLNSDHLRQKKNIKESKNSLSKNKKNKNILYKFNKLKSNIHISRNQKRNIFFPHSLGQSLSQSRSINKENSNNQILIRSSSFITKSVDNNINNKKFSINNIKMQKNKITKKRINEIIKNSTILDKNLGISDGKYLYMKNKNMLKSLKKNSKNRFQMPINIKQSFNINQKVFKNK